MKEIGSSSIKIAQYELWDDTSSIKMILGGVGCQQRRGISSGYEARRSEALLD